jgi:hypothetical protein
MTLLAALASGATLDAAFVWLCKRRRDYSDDADVWDFRRDWPGEKARLHSDLSAGDIRFGLPDRITKVDGEEVDLWSARDALVLKALAMVLARLLPVSRSCTHVKGHGGAKAAVRHVMAKLADNRFVLKTDVKFYYASIDHHRLLDRLATHVRDKAVLNLIGQYLRRTAERGGEFWDYDKGISLGCPLSPLIGAFFLDDLDRRMARSGLFYVRFIDDVLVLSPTRWKLRRAGGQGRQRGAGRPGPREAPGQDLHRPDRERLRLSGLPLRPGGPHHGREDHRAVRRTCAPALRAGAGGAWWLLPARVVRAAVGQVDEGGASSGTNSSISKITPTGQC